MEIKPCLGNFFLLYYNKITMTSLITLTRLNVTIQFQEVFIGARFLVKKLFIDRKRNSHSKTNIFLTQL